MFWLYEIKENVIPFSPKKVKTPSCYFEKNLNTLLSFTLKKVFALLHSALAPLYSKFFKPPYFALICLLLLYFTSLHVTSCHLTSPHLTSHMILSLGNSK